MLEHYEMAFRQDYRRFDGFRALGFWASDLIDDPDWAWSYDPGVYCFARGREILYVGRAVGKTLGERVADRLRSAVPSGRRLCTMLRLG